MDMIYKTFRADVKDINTEDGSLNLFIPVSTDSVDRDGEIVEPMAFKKTLPKFMKRPVLISSHDYKDLTSQIGEWTKLKITEHGIEGKPKYYVGQGNEQADWGFKLASKGMAAFSIGFIPTKWEDGDGVKSPRRTYQEVELLEISQVIVPSNRDAIQSIRSKSVDPVSNKLFDDILADKELVAKPEEVKDHVGKSANELSQEEVVDEIDYLTIMIDKAGLNDKAAELLKELLRRLFDGGMELKQPDMAVMEKMMAMMADCEGKAGEAKDMAQGMMDDMKSVESGNDIPVEIGTHVPVALRELPLPEKTGVESLDILESIKRVAKT